MTAAEAWRSATSETCHHCRAVLGFLEGPLCDECVEWLPMERLPSDPPPDASGARRALGKDYLAVDLTTRAVRVFPGA